MILGAAGGSMILFGLIRLEFEVVVGGVALLAAAFATRSIRLIGADR